MVSHEEYMELLAKAKAGTMTAEDFKHSFSLKSKEGSLYPVLGVLIICRFPHLVLLNEPLRDWVRSAGTLLFMDMHLRMQFDLIVQPACQYTEQSAIEVLKENPQFHEAMIRAMLMMEGLNGSQHWERAIGFGDPKGVDFALQGGLKALGGIILDHIKEAPVADLRLLMGGNPDGTEFDGRNLIRALAEAGNEAEEDDAEEEDYLHEAAWACAARVPELFLYRGRCFGLEEEYLNVLYLFIAESGAARKLRDSQKEELLRGDLIPADARKNFKRRWKM